MSYRLLDAYCCEGGASRGYELAGFTVEGVDIFEDYTQARYPYPSHKSDAVAFIKEHAHQYDALHTSPPCQRHTAGTRYQNRDNYPDLIEPTRQALIATGLPYVIENVVGAPLIDPVMLCGRQFNLSAVDDDGTPLVMDRHRLFETNWLLPAPPTCQPHDRTLQVAGAYGGARRDKTEARHVRHGGYVPAKHIQQQLLGIDWMTQKGMHQALPPAYTRYIGERLIAHLDAA